MFLFSSDERACVWLAFWALATLASAVLVPLAASLVSLSWSGATASAFLSLTEASTLPLAARVSLATLAGAALAASWWR